MGGEDDLVRAAMPLVQSVSRGLARRLGKVCEVDDLIGIAKVALYDVIRAYDPRRAEFSVYAPSKLKWAIIDEVRRQTHGRSARARLAAVMASERFGEAFEVELPATETEPTVEAWQAKLSELLEGHAAALAVGLCQSSVNVARLTEVKEEEESPEAAAARAEIAAHVRRSVEALPDTQRELVERHYFAGEPFDAIAASLGISKSWASRQHERAMVALGKMLRGIR